jgi:peroxiredoxin
LSRTSAHHHHSIRVYTAWCCRQQTASRIEANATSGVRVSNNSFGHVVVLYFTPEDNTPGCTTEAMQFRDRYKDFVKAGAISLACRATT